MGLEKFHRGHVKFPQTGIDLGHQGGNLLWLERALPCRGGGVLRRQSQPETGHEVGQDGLKLRQRHLRTGFSSQGCFQAGGGGLPVPASQVMGDLLRHRFEVKKPAEQLQI
ncbi:MAG: hypothetical protein KF760_30675 [Candidatus Eremiobacteraeota bacterium]|nr:hypothetical protein [Candidatus Eremiobacteraeota bacterium]MCW5868613.1 hypothetical protein [Candidatus Eremiobacteraeota bacterium]